MASDFDRYLSKSLLFGSPPLEDRLIHCGTAPADTSGQDTNFIATVSGLTQNFALVPQNVKEAYLVHILKTKKLKTGQ